MKLSRQFIALRTFIDLATIVPLLLCCPGCSSPTTTTKAPVAPVSVSLQSTNHVGGTHYRTIMRDGRWYQTFSNKLLVIDPRTARAINELELCEFGTSGAAIDMAITTAGDMFIVLERDEVVSLSLDDPAKPEIIARVNHSELGFDPLSISVVNDAGVERVFICGDGGAALFDVKSRILPGRGIVGSVAMGSSGIVATVDRRVYDVESSAFIGSASELFPYPDGSAGQMVFVRRTDAATQIGIMEPDIRELQARTATTAVMGTVNRVRCFDGSIWIVTPTNIYGYTLKDEKLELRQSFNVRGALDVDMIDANHLAVAGTFGRSIYRINADEKGAGDTFTFAQREPSRLTNALSDRLQILAGTAEEGTWLYQIGSDATLMDKALTRQPPPTRETEITDGRASLSEDSMAVLMTLDGKNVRWLHPRGWKLYCINAVEGRLWVGHEHGLVVLDIEQPTPEEYRAAEKAEQPPPAPKLKVKGELRLDGPVAYLFPLLTGRGAAYVAEFGGFGTAELIPD